MSVNPNIEKTFKAINNLKLNVEFVFYSEGVTNEEEFNQIEWVTGEDSNGIAITTNTCPHSEITYAKIVEEMDKL